MLSIRNIVLSFAVALTLIGTVGWIPERVHTVPQSGSDLVAAFSDSESAENQNLMTAPRSSRSPADPCFDVPLKERANCDTGHRTAMSLKHTGLGECFDVPLSQRANCDLGSQRAASGYRSRLDECFDVPLSQRAQCNYVTVAAVP